MKTPADIETRICRDLARLAGAGLQIPDFLVLSEGPDATFKWLDGGFLPVVRHWLAAPRGEALLSEAIELVSDIGAAMTMVLGSFLDMHAGAAVPSWERRHMAWKMRRQALLDWLGQTGVQDLNAAARAWQGQPGGSEHQADDTVDEWLAWDLIHTQPGLSGLRAALLHQMEGPPVPEPGTVERRCGMRAPASL
jgi:hypothetical protein